MTKSKQERINELARSLKELHLASSEDAMSRAREIIESSSDESTPINELNSLKSETKSVVSDAISDIHSHNSLSSDEQMLKDSLDKIKESIDDIDAFVKIAKKRQEPKK